MKEFLNLIQMGTDANDTFEYLNFKGSFDVTEYALRKLYIENSPDSPADVSIDELHARSILDSIDHLVEEFEFTKEEDKEHLRETLKAVFAFGCAYGHSYDSNHKTNEGYKKEPEYMDLPEMY